MSEDNWRAALAEALRANTPLTGWQRDLRDYALSVRQAQNLADALLPVVRHLAAEELRAAAEIRASDWPAARALILYRANALGTPTTGGGE